MKFLGFELVRRSKAIQNAAGALSIDEVIRRIESIMATASGISVTPETALYSPTVLSIVRAISGTISTLPIHVYRKSVREDRDVKEEQPSHPVAKLLANPNATQDYVNYWLDATSWLVRYNNYYAFKGRGATGPIRRLEPLPPHNVVVEQQDDLTVIYRVRRADGSYQSYTRASIHHARGLSRDGIVGNSPVMDIRESIAMEIAIERFGASYFGNGAMPSLIFEYIEGVKGFQTDEQRREFLSTFEAAYGGKNRFRAAIMPYGMKVTTPISINNEQAQFLETRQHQRTVIAGAFGVPPHLVGDLQRSTFSNVEQQSLDFIQNVILPYVRIFEASMEKDLLTQEDRNSGIIIRFNVDAALRGDFKTRQEGLNIQRSAGVISPNEWREKEGMNPRTDEGGDTYWDAGPSGQQPQPQTNDRQNQPDQEEPQPTNGNGARNHVRR